MQTLIIPAAFAFLAAILLWITIGIQGKWWLKLLAMFVTLLVSLEMWRSLDSYVGYFKTADLGSLTNKRATLFGPSLFGVGNC
jgi:formate hydrogenlyase subunit 3/multisubunit Na+/H+ antiporter MnhD subunit